MGGQLGEIQGSKGFFLFCVCIPDLALMFCGSTAQPRTSRVNTRQCQVTLRMQLEPEITQKLVFSPLRSTGNLSAARPGLE